MREARTAFSTLVVHAVLVCTVAAGGSGSAEAKTTWTLVYSNPNSDNQLIHVTALDGQHGWAVGVMSGANGTEPMGLVTNDGVSWSQMMLPQGTGPMDLTLFMSLAFTDVQNGWLFGIKFTGNNCLWTTSDGGMSWELKFYPTEQVDQIQALPPGHFFGGGGQTVVVSSDGENYYEYNPSLPQDTAIRGIHMLNSECGYLVAATDPEVDPFTSAVLWSGDGGENWETRSQDLPFYLRRLWFVGPDLGWAAGFQGSTTAPQAVIARTTDGGRTWNAVTLPDHPAVMGGDPVPADECMDLRFFDDTRGVAACTACSGGCDTDTPSFLTVFVRTYDGGQTWEMDPDYEGVMTAPPFGDMMKFSGLKTMAFPEPNVGFLTGENHLVLRYVADDPEQSGWGQADCNSNGNSNGNHTNANGNGSGPGADDAALSGCGCMTGSGPKGSVPLLLLCVVFFALLRRRFA